jgi:hypothetical protein
MAGDATQRLQVIGQLAGLGKLARGNQRLHGTGEVPEVARLANTGRLATLVQVPETPGGLFVVARSDLDEPEHPFAPQGEDDQVFFMCCPDPCSCMVPRVVDQTEVSFSEGFEPEPCTALTVDPQPVPLVLVVGDLVHQCGPRTGPEPDQQGMSTTAES